MNEKNIRKILSQHPFTTQTWWASVYAVLKELEIPDPSKSAEENNLNSFLYGLIAFEKLSETDKIKFIENSGEFQKFVEALHRISADISEDTARIFFDELEQQVIYDKQMLKKR